jgi:hypothetical protein
LIRFRYRICRTVNKTRLYRAPGLHEACAICRLERTEMKPFDSLRAPFERRFRMPPAAIFLDSPSVFRVTELSAQPFSPPLSERKDRGGD